MLVGADGYVRLVDFAFSKALAPSSGSGERAGALVGGGGAALGELQRCHTLCGTPEYLAPEQVLGLGHGLGADCWALGVLLYELLCAATPFESEHQAAVFEKISARTTRVRFPANGVPEEARALVQQLLAWSPAERLGAMRGGLADVRRAPWFAQAGVSEAGGGGSGYFEALMRRELTPPFLPRLSGPLDPSFYGCQHEPIEEVPAFAPGADKHGDALFVDF